MILIYCLKLDLLPEAWFIAWIFCC